MMRSFGLLLVLVLSVVRTSAQELGIFQTLYDRRSVSTQTFTIQLKPIDDNVRFAVTLKNNETGLERRHEFEGQGSNDVTPYLFGLGHYCDASVILLTVYYPWRHALPQYAYVLDTIAFDRLDFSFIDVTFGSITDIAILDSSDPESDLLYMQPPVLVECLPAGSEVPFRFVENPVE